MSSNRQRIEDMKPSLSQTQQEVCRFTIRLLRNNYATENCKLVRLVLRKDWGGVKRCLDIVRDHGDTLHVLGQPLDANVASIYGDCKTAHAQLPSSKDWEGAFKMGAWVLGVGAALLLGYWFISVVGMFDAKPGQMSELELLKQENLALKNQTEDLLSQTAALASRVAQLEKVNSSRLEERVFVLEHLANEIREEVKNEVNAEILALNQSSKQAVESVYNYSLLQVAAYNKSVKNMQTSANILRQHVNEFRSEARGLNQTLHETREDLNITRFEAEVYWNETIIVKDKLLAQDQLVSSCMWHTDLQLDEINASIDARLKKVNASLELATSLSSAALWTSMSSLAIGFAGFVVIVVVYTWYCKFMYNLVMRGLEPRVLALETNLTGRVVLLEESLKPAVDAAPSGPGMRGTRRKGT